MHLLSPVADMQTNPIVIIGAGRSGTTLLSETLSAHPDFYMPAEPNFLLPKLFHVIWTETEYVTTTKANALLQRSLPKWRDSLWADFVNEYRSSPVLQQHTNSMLAHERARIIEVLRSTFISIIMPPELERARWGFKEIWNGHPLHDYSWSLYNEVFPDARWVHAIRHPFEFARSCAGLHSNSLTYDELKMNLSHWVKMNRRAEEQQNTGRYLAYRFEDLVTNTANQLAAIFDFLELPLHERCRVAAMISYMKNLHKPPLPEGPIEELMTIEGLAELMERYHYCSTCA